jgi:hypothetical protein
VAPTFASKRGGIELSSNIERRFSLVSSQEHYARGVRGSAISCAVWRRVKDYRSLRLRLRVWIVADVGTFKDGEGTTNGFRKEKADEEEGMVNGSSWIVSAGV